MSELKKLDFHALELSGKNYITWTSDLKVHLQARELQETICENNATFIKQKAQAMEIIRHHINENLKAEYMNIEDPLILWKSLKNRFERMRDIDLPKAQHEWIHLRFQDFKTVSEYSSELHRIAAILEFCGEKKSEGEKIEKTLSTFHADQITLQSTIRQNKVNTFGELLTDLTRMEEQNQILLRNHELRPPGAMAPPEVNNNMYRGNGNPNRGRARGFRRGRGRGRNNNNGGRGQSHDNNTGGRGRGRNQRRGGNRSHPYNRGNLVWTRDGSQNPNGNFRNNDSRSVCYKCGSTEHFLRQCRTPQHLVDLYQASQKGKLKVVETNAANVESGEGTSQGNISSFHTSDFFDDLDIENFLNSAENVNKSDV